MPRKKKTEAEVEAEKKERKEEIEKESEKESEKKKKKLKAGEKVKEAEKEKLLVPLDNYTKVAVHFGTKAITPGMRRFVYKRRADGIAVLNTKKIDEKISAAASFLSQYESEKIMVCCKRDAGHAALEAFGNAIGARIFQKYSAGMITNPQLENFFEPDVVVVADPWLDRNALMDAVKIHVPIVAFCDTNNPTEYVDFIIPCNNKTSKSLGLIFYLLAKLYLQKRKIKAKLNTEDFYKLEEEQQAS